MLDLRNVSVMSIQLCLLVGAYFSNDGEALSEGIYYSTACRMAALLRLDEYVSSNLLEQEHIVRLLWTVNMSDVWSSHGNRVSRMLPPLPARYPIEEHSFNSLRRVTLDIDALQPPPVLPEFSPLSLVANIIQLNGILAQVADAINSASNVFGSGNAIDLQVVDSLATQLDSWYENLDARLKDTEENLQYHALQGTAHIFVSLYLGYYHYGQLLYYVYLQDDASIGLQTGVHPHAARCKGYAAGLCDLLYRAYETPGAEVYYSMVGHVLVVASTVQIHTVLFDTNEANILLAKQRLERNYQILTELLCFWPTLDVTMGRLRGFHKACLRSKEGSFRMDQWMLKFLFEFAKPVEDKPTQLIDVLPEWPILSPALTDFAFSEDLSDDIMSHPSV